jgi:uncharacterized integral membrane protein
MNLIFHFPQQNNDPMTITFFQYTSDVQAKWKILLIAAVIGALITTVFFILELVVLESKNLRLRRTNKKLLRTLEKLQRKDNTPASSNSDIEPAIKISELDLDSDEDV